MVRPSVRAMTSSSVKMALNLRAQRALRRAVPPTMAISAQIISADATAIQTANPDISARITNAKSKNVLIRNAKTKLNQNIKAMSVCMAKERMYADVQKTASAKRTLNATHKR